MRPPPGANKAGICSARKPTSVMGPVGGAESQRRTMSYAGVPGTATAVIRVRPGASPNAKRKGRPSTNWLRPPKNRPVM
jgi:hypothetical protein